MTTAKQHAEWDDALMPTLNAWLFDRFARYVQYFLGKNFDAVRVLRPGMERLKSMSSDRPIIICSNHPSWWDPMIATVTVAACLPERKTYAPIDAEMLEKYGVFKKLGFYGIEQNSRRGGVQFLRTSLTILNEPTQHRNVIWVTGEGTFSDPRQRPIELRLGISHLAARMPEAYLVPVVMEYPFWMEKRPEALIHVGEPIDAESVASQGNSQEQISPDVLGQQLSDAMGMLLDELATASIQRDADAFDLLVQGRSGMGGMYEWFRMMGAWTKGKRFDPRHMPEPMTTGG